MDEAVAQGESRGCGGVGCGIARQRERQVQEALAVVADAYPGWLWRDDPPLRPSDPVLLSELGRRLEEAAPVRAFVAAAEKRDLAAWLYLLAGIHAPSLWEIREGRASGAPARVRETYLRCGVSRLGPFATLQECVLSADDDGTTAVITELPALGVEDRRLRDVVKCAQGITREVDLVLLDAAFLSRPAPGGNERDSRFERAFGVQPTLWSFLFDALPPTTSRASASASWVRTG